MAFTTNDIIEQLSYAYLHAVAAKARFACEPVVSRQLDGAGVDARVGWKERFDANTVHTNAELRVQLKATTAEPALVEDRYSYWLKDVEKYDELRERSGPFPTLLVVLFLPSAPAEWLSLDHDGLIARRCAYWVSLWGAPAPTTTTGVTIHLPRSNMLTPDNLRDVERRCSIEDDILYAG